MLLSPAGQRRRAEIFSYYQEHLRSWIGSVEKTDPLSRFLQGPSVALNFSYGPIADLLYQILPPPAQLLFIGGTRPSDRRYFGRYDWLVLDIMPGDGVDVIGDGQELPLVSGSIDLIIAQALLEHVPDPVRIIAEARRVLRPGGVLYVNVPFLQPYHWGPLDYRRYSLTGLVEAMKDFEKIEAGVAAGPASALSAVWRAFVASFSDDPGRRRWLAALAGWLAWPLKFADLYLARKQSAWITASAVYYVGRKSKIV